MVAKELEDYVSDEGRIREVRDAYGGYGHIERFRVLLECGSVYHSTFGSKGDRRPWQEISVNDFRRRFMLPSDRIVFSIKQTKQALVSDKDGRIYELNVLLTEMEDYNREKHDFIFLEHNSEPRDLRLAALRNGEIWTSRRFELGSYSEICVYLTANQAVNWSFRGKLEALLGEKSNE